jgi:hypothetical protein
MTRRRWQFFVIAGTALFAALALFEAHKLVYDRAATQLREEARVSGQLRTLPMTAPSSTPSPGLTQKAFMQSH